MLKEENSGSNSMAEASTAMTQAVDVGGRWSSFCGTEGKWAAAHEHGRSLKV
jgi:hypothetical protein